MTTKQQGVQAYTEQGFTLFPCGAGEDHKAPLYGTAWLNTPYSPLLCPSDLPDYFGVVLPPDIVVIDYDPYRDESYRAGGPKEIDLLFRQLELEPTHTYVVQTGSGGTHFYFRKPPEVKVIAKLKPLGYQSIDIKTHGGYVLAAGSKHHSGNSYIVLQGSLDSIETIPEKLLDFIRRSYEPVITEGDFESDDEPTIKRAIEYLRNRLVSRGSDRSRFATACYLKNLGLSKAKTLELMQEHYDDDADGLLESKVEHAWEYSQENQGSKHPVQIWGSHETPPIIDPDELAKIFNKRLRWHWRDDKVTGEKIYLRRINNTCNFLRRMPTRSESNPLHNIVRYNELSHKIDVLNAPWDTIENKKHQLLDTDVFNLKEYLSHEAYDATSEMVREAIEVVSRENRYHPIQDYLNSIQWDGVPRIDLLFPKYAGSPDTLYTRAVSKNILIAAVARVMEPGCQHDSMPVMEGPQKSGKTSFIRILGGEWYGNPKIDPGDTKTLERMQGFWFIEMAEMEVLRRSDVNALKNFLTTIVDNDRFAYKRYAEQYPRQSVFIGSINPEGDRGYLTDRTGNRRFCPVLTTGIRLADLKADRDQLFAEAFHRYKQSEKWYITDPVVEAIATQEQFNRLLDDEWTGIVQSWLDSNDLPELLTTQAIAWQALNISLSNLGKLEANRLNSTMRELGYQRIQISKHGIRYWIWQPKTDLLEGVI